MFSRTLLKIGKAAIAGLAVGGVGMFVCGVSAPMNTDLSSVFVRGSNQTCSYADCQEVDCYAAGNACQHVDDYLFSANYSCVFQEGKNCTLSDFTDCYDTVNCTKNPLLPCGQSGDCTDHHGPCTTTTTKAYDNCTS
jgi:hypothetical protein